MLFTRRLINQIMISTLVMIFANINLLSAQENYPLTWGEQVITERDTTEGQLEIFTEIQGESFKKLLDKENNQWIVKYSEKLSLSKTGLKINNYSARKTPQLSNALEQKLLTEGYSLANLPSVVDYSSSPYLPPVGFQQEDSCVGWSVGYYLRTYQQVRDIGWEVKRGLQTINTHVFSPSFVYNQINQGEDKGAYLSDAGELLKRTGIATLASFPYIPRDYTTQPGAEVMLKAAPHKIREWETLYNIGDSMEYIIQKTREYLNTGDLLIAGSRIGFNFRYPMLQADGKSIIITDNYAPYGHAYLIVGYDDNMLTPEGRGAFKILNSWGEEWGNRGFSYITYQAFKANIMGGYVFTDMVNGPLGNSSAALPVRVNDKVYFNLNFSGKGNYSIEIRDAFANPVYRLQDIQSDGGDSQIKWPGTNLAGQRVNDGEYELQVSTGNNGTGVSPAPYQVKFLKQSMTKDLKAVTNRLEDFMQSVGISFTPLVEGKVTIRVKNQGNTSTIISDNPVKSLVPYEYIINKGQFDFNNVDLATTYIEIEVK